MTEWISVKDRVPDPKIGDRKLVFSSSEGICTARFNEDYFDLEPAGDHSTGGFIPEVTHWAELPQAPNE